MPRLSTESTAESTTGSSIDNNNISRLSPSSEGSKDTDTHIVRPSYVVDSSKNGSLHDDLQTNQTDLISLQSRIASLEEANANLRSEKQKSDSAYNSLLLRVNDIRKSLTTRFQQNEEQLSQNAETIETLESENASLRQTITTLQTEINSLSTETSLLSNQISLLRRETSKYQNREAEWDKERMKFEKLKRNLEGEIDNLKVMVGNWERTASEEHALAESSRDRVLLLEEEISSYRDHQDSARGETERYRGEVDHLRNVLRDVQEEQKRELRDVVEGMEGQIERLNLNVEQAEKRAVDAEVSLNLNGVNY